MKQIITKYKGTGNIYKLVQEDKNKLHLTLFKNGEQIGLCSLYDVCNWIEQELMTLQYK